MEEEQAAQQTTALRKNRSMEDAAPAFTFTVKKRNKNMRKRKADETGGGDDETTIKRGKELEKKGLMTTTKVQREVSSRGAHAWHSSVVPLHDRRKHPRLTDWRCLP